MDKMSKPSKRAAKLLLDIDTSDIKITLNPEVPQPVSMDKVVQGEIAKTETVCEKARRLVREEEIRLSVEKYTQKQAFLSQFGLEAREDGYVYELCGRKWTYLKFMGEGHLYPHSSERYRGLSLSTPSHGVNDLLSLGQVTQDMQNRECLLRCLYPRTIWGTIKLMYDYPFSGHIWG
jgi:hypothetical protein